MKFTKYVLFDEYPDNDEVKLCIFTRPLYPIQHRNRWNKNIKFACSPSALNAFRLLKIKEAFQITEYYRCKIAGQELRLRCIEQDAFGSYMLIIQSMDYENKHILYTGQFTNYRTALINGLSSDLMDKITDVFIDNTLAFTEHANSMVAACDEVQNYLKKYEDYKVYLDFENLVGYEELLVNLAQRKIKIQLHTFQTAIMKCGNNLQDFEFNGKPDLKVFYRPDRNNWKLEDYERFFNDDKSVYLKFIETQDMTKIESKCKGFHYIVYSPHASKHTLANFMRLLEPSRIHPLYLPSQIDYEWSNVIPNDIIPNSSELLIIREPVLSAIDLNEKFDQMQNNDENASQLRLSYHSSIQSKQKCNKSFLASSSDEETIDGISNEMYENMQHKVVNNSRKQNTKSDEESGEDNDKNGSDSTNDTESTISSLKFD